MSLPVEVTIDSSQVEEAMRQAGKALPEGLDRVADAFLEAIKAEAPRGTTGNLQEDWSWRREDDTTRIVEAGRDAFYAHMVARGRRGYTREEASGSARAFRIGEEWRMFMGPVAPNPFHERAGQRVDHDVARIFGEVLQR